MKETRLAILFGANLVRARISFVYFKLSKKIEWNGGLAEGRLFLKQSPTTENVILSVGVISLFFAYLISWLVKWKSASLFTPTQGFLNPVSTIPT